MPFENFALDWLTIVESDIAAVPQGGTGGAAPAFVTNHDFASIAEPAGGALGTNNQVICTSTGFDINGVADGTVGYDRFYRDFGAPTFGGGLGDFNIEFEYAYWDGMARGTGYVLLGLANSAAARFYNGAGKGITPAPTGGAGWDLMVDDSAGYWFGEDGSGATLVSGTTDLVGSGFPSRADGTIYFVQLFWNDTTKQLTITEYTDDTRTVIAATATIAPADTAFTSQFIVCCTNENQIKTAFSGRDQSAQFQNLNLNMVSGSQASATITDSGDTASATADVQLVSITHTFRDGGDTAGWADGINVVAIKSSTLTNPKPTILGSGIIAGGLGSVTINLTENTPVTLVPDHQNNLAPTGEQGISPSLIPLVV